MHLLPVTLKKKTEMDFHDRHEKTGTSQPAIYRLWERIDRFWGRIDQPKISRGRIDHFWGRIDRFWGRIDLGPG